MKFFNLLKKELAELLNAQTIISLVVVMGLLMFMGSFMSDTVEEAVKQEYSVTLVDRDNTEFTADMKEKLKTYGAKLVEVTDSSEDYTAALVEKDGNFITAKGPGAALEFAFTIVEKYCGCQMVNELKHGMMIQA